MRPLVRVLNILGFVGLGLLCPVVAVAQDSPLIMEGKERLFQRVLVRDAVAGFDAPEGVAGDMLAPLTPLYVYERNGDWLKVGPNDDGETLVWMPASAAVNWNQNIVATFEGSENLARLLFFKELDPIYDLLELETPGLKAQDFRAAAEAAEAGGAQSDTIVALGPRRVVDQRSNLYVMPILEFEEEVFDSGSFVNLLKVAVARAQPATEVDPEVLPEVLPDAPKVPSRRAAPKDYRSGIVFVVDTTVSMDPYIRATRDALAEVYAEVEAAGVADAVSFGLIGYRDSLQAAPDLGYATQTFVTLQDGLTSGAFLAGVDQMTEATTSSRNFREDSYAGIEHALTQMDWADFDERYIVLVTDAGPRDARDEYSKTGLSGKGINSVVRERVGGAIAVFHLKSSRGENDHARAEAAYRDLASFPNQAPLYFPIEDGDANVFRDNARDLGRLISQQVLEFRKSPDDVLEGEDKAISEKGPDGGPKSNRFDGVLSAGRTMQLAFLGRTEGTKAPYVFEAYVADRDFDRTGLKPLSIRVLVSKSELSNLFEALTIIVEKGEENVINPDQFFGQVLGAAADMSRRPDKVARQADVSLAEAVSIEEYIEDLPYKSRIMRLTQEDWLDMPFSEQASIINELYEKLNRYSNHNEATDLWVDYLGNGADADTLLYPLPLDDLP